MSANNLQQEVDAKAKEIHADAYPMSIGELVSIYRDKELDIHPEFQRLFRWSIVQKSKFIESILLGIPIPSIFVSQRDDGIWDVVDGVQRLSTIFEFLGILLNKDGQPVPPSSLVGTEYLPSLEGRLWENKEDEDSSFPNALRLHFKRQKLDLKIIKRESDVNAKYDLFERLNTLGSQLSDQEVRNCLLVMINPRFHAWLDELSRHVPFKKTLTLSDRALQERYDMELALRFIIFTREPNDELQTINDIGVFVTQKMRTLAADPTFDFGGTKKLFERTFQILFDTFGEGCFTRTSEAQGRGGFLISVFEVLAVGLGSNLLRNVHVKVDSDQIKRALKQVWREHEFKKHAKSGVRASSRLPRLIPLGRRLFNLT